jgi:hypothetical protein
MREIRTLRATWRGLETWNGQIATAAGAPVLDPTAFACHTVCELAAGPWRAARRELVTRQGFFQALRIITSYLVFDSWDDLLRTLAFARPPPLGP